jgi:hypothetical protein
MGSTGLTGDDSGRRVPASGLIRTAHQMLEEMGMAQYHLSNVFARLGIISRSQLDRVLPAVPGTSWPR